MTLFEGYDDLNFINPVVTIGIFDGVHLGHKEILDRVVSRAEQKGGESVVITFNPHPRLVLSKETQGISFLSTLDEKKELMEKSHIDNLIIMNFNKKISQMEAGDFIREILINKIGVKHLIVGYDNHFGKGKGGDIKKIREYSELFDFEVEQVGEVSVQNNIISSTLIRDALIDGRLSDANKWLGYDYSITGKVVQGKKLGRSFGFPTANIQPADIFKLIPANGVYAVEVMIDNQNLPGMLSIGYNPTVNKAKDKRSIEVHIFDFNRDLYEQTIRITFRFRLRDERKFENTMQLTNQMKLDKQVAQRLLS